MNAAAWSSIGVSLVAIVLALVFNWQRSSLAKRVGQLESEAETLRRALRWFERQSMLASRPPLTGPESVDRLNRLPNRNKT